MLEHSYRILEMRYGKNMEKRKNSLTIDFIDPTYEILSTLLSSEVVCFEKNIKKSFDIVLSGLASHYEFGGNVCVIEISQTTTKVYDSLAEDGMGNWCEVDTRELRMLIDEWCEKYELYKKNNINPVF